MMEVVVSFTIGFSSVCSNHSGDVAIAENVPHPVCQRHFAKKDSRSSC